MLDKEFEYLAFDAQYILYRNFAALQGRTRYQCSAVLDDDEGDSTICHIINKYEFSMQALVKQFFWSIGKLIRDDYGVHKILLFWDTPPYIKCKWLPDYKGSRIHWCKEYLDEFDPEVEPQEYLQAKEDLRVHEIFNEAKAWIQLNLRWLGMVSVWYPGYEADDLAYIFSQLMLDVDTNMKSAICSADSDWSYWISDKVEWINFNTREHWSYQDICEQNDNWTEKLGLTLFELKTWLDSLMGSHNDIQYTSAVYSRNELDIIYNEVKKGIYDNITDKDLLERNLKSFSIMDYPDIDKVKLKILGSLKAGCLWDESCMNKMRRDGFLVSDNYIDTYYEQLSPEYYTDKP